jgi:hypothetical protein
VSLDPAHFRLAPDHPLQQWGRRGLLFGGPALALAVVGAFIDTQQFFRSYLIGWTFWAGIALGSMAILMIHHVAGGAWGAVIRRPLESAVRTIPLLAVLFIPIFVGVHELYEWAHPGATAHDPILAAKAMYLNVPFFRARAIFYFACWIAVAYFLGRWSIEQDRDATSDAGRKLQFLSQGGLLVYGLTVSFAAVDWLMSLEPHWFSTVYGLLVMGGQGLAAFAFAIPITAALARNPGQRIIGPSQLRDLGSFLLAFVMIWAYLSLSQLLIIWSANLPEEISWYLHRSEGGWRTVGYGLVVFHFAVPFVVLLSRGVKQRAPVLARVAIALLAMRFVELFWLIAPSWETHGFALHWLDVVAPIGIGGIWLWFFVHQLARHPVLPIGDPALPAAGVGE